MIAARIDARYASRNPALGLILALLLGCAGQPTFSAAEQLKLDELLVTMKSQLELAAQAARDSWLAHRPVDDPRAEAEFVDSAVNRAFEHTLPPETVQEFFRAQIEAAKHVQSTLHQQWQSEPKTRPQAGAMSADAARARVAPSSTALLSALAHAHPVLRREGGRKLLEERADVVFAGVPGGPHAATLAITPLWKLAQ